MGKDLFCDCQINASQLLPGSVWKKNNKFISEREPHLKFFHEYLKYSYQGFDSVPSAAAKLLQSCPTLCDPIDGSPPGSPSLGFSRQEHWSGLPFPSPMHESEKWKWSHSVVSDSGDLPGKSTGVGCHCLLWTLYHTLSQFT